MASELLLAVFLLTMRSALYALIRVLCTRLLGIMHA